MEQWPILPDGAAGRRAGIGLTRDTLAHILSSASAAPVAADGAFASLRGDHSLNPDMVPDAPLVPAAVLVPVVDRPEGLTVLFTLRTSHLANHAGQISFPGGRIEPEDASPEDGALRETEEEVGLNRACVTVVGRLGDYITRTGFRVTPVVGIVTPPFTVAPDAFEVADVFEVPLDFLLDPTNHQRHSRMIKGIERTYFAMPYGDRYIWGATAGMLMNLYDIVCEAS